MFEFLRVEAVTGSWSVDRTNNQSRVFQHLQMLRDSGLDQWQHLYDLTTETTAFGGQSANDFKACRMTQRTQDYGHIAIPGDAASGILPM